MVDEKERAQSISETITDGLLELDLHGKILQANPAALSMLGFTLQDITKKTHRDLTPAKWHQQESQSIQETNLAQHKEITVEQEYLRQNNSIFPVALKPILLTGPDQKPAKILILFQDLTRQKEQEQLQQTHQRQLNSLSLITRKLQENDTVDQSVHFVLEALAAAMKYPEVAVPLIAIEDETFSTNKYSDELDYGLTASIFVNGREAGEVTVYYSENKPFTLPDEQHILETVAQSLGVWLAQKSAAQELADLEDQYQSMFNAIADPVFVKNDQYRFVFVNDTLCTLLGQSRENLIGKTGGEYLPQEQMEVFLAKDKGVLETGVENINEEKLTDGQGRVRDIVTKKTRYIDSAGKKFIVGVISDITERKQAEEKLIFNNLILLTQQETSIDGILVVDEKGKIISFNQRFISIWSIPPAVIESKSDEQALQSVMDKLASPEEFMSKVKHLYEAKYELSSDEIVLKDGRIFDRYSSPMLDAEGKYYGRVWYFRDITERRQMEEELLERAKELKCLYSIAGLDEKEDKLEKILQGSADLMPDGWVYSTIACARIIYKGKQYQTKNFRETEWRLSADLTVAGQPAGVVELYYLEERPNRDEGPFLKEERNLIKAIAEKLGKVSERKQMEANLHLRQQELNIILDSSPAMIFYKDKENKFIRVNQAMAKGAGLTREEMENKSAFDLFPREMAEQYWQDDKAVMAAGQPELNIIESMETKEGLKWVQTDKIPYKNEQGEITGVIGFTFDITERKQAEEQVLKAAQEWADTFDSMADGVSIHSPDYTILNVNKVLCQILGKPKEEIIGKKCFEIFHGLNSPVPGCPLEKSKSTLKEEYAELFEPLLNRWIAATVSPILDETGKVVKIIHLIRDITEQKQAEELVKQSELQYRTLVSNLPGAVYRCVNDADWTMYFISPAIESLSGYPAADFIDNKVRSYNSIIYPDDCELVNDTIQQQLKKKDSYNLDYRLLHRDGSTRWVTEKGQGIYDDKGTLLWLDGAIFDITERKRIEEELKKRMNELDRFNRVTMEREKRIIELKKKVKELEQESHGQK